MGAPIKYSLAVIIYLFAFTQLQAQVDPDFNTSFIKVGNVQAIRHQPDGKTLIGGGFSYAGTSIKNRILRINVDGSIDDSFDTGQGPNDLVYDIFIQADGKILICGNFTSYNGLPVKYLARLNADGSLDNTFNAGGTGASGAIYRIFEKPNGGCLLLGTYNNYNNQPTSYLFAINENGAIDENFDPNAGSYIGASGTCSLDASVTITPDNKILYTDCLGKGIVRLNADGTLDETFNFPSDIRPFRATAVQVEDEKFIIAGRFTEFEGNQNVTRVVRFNSDGTKDESFNVYSTSNAFQKIRKTPSGQLMLASGNSQLSLIRLNADGSVDGGFTPLSLADGNNSATLSSITLHPDGTMWLGGNNLVIDQKNEALFNLNMDGTFSTLPLPKLGDPATIYDAVKDADGSLLVLGNFYYVNNSRQPFLARIDVNGELIPSFTPPSIKFPTNVRSLENPNAKIRLQSDGKIILSIPGMEVEGVGGTKSIVRLSPQGIYDPTFVTSIQSYSEINILEVKQNDKILVGGDFNLGNGENLIGDLAMLEKDGANDPAFFVEPEVLDFRPYAALILPNDRIIVGGSKSYLAGQPGKLIALTQTGNLYPDFSWDKISTGIPPSSIVPRSIALTEDGLLIGGRIASSYSGNTQDQIVYLNTDGSPKNFQSKIKTLVHTTTTYQVGNRAIIYGGSAVNNSQNGLRFIDSTGNPEMLPFISIIGSVQKIIPISDTRILIVGNIQIAGNKPVGSIFAYNIPATNTGQITNLQAVVQSPSKVNLSWEYTGDETFEVFRSNNETDGFIKIAALKGANYVDHDAIQGSTNYYKVRSSSLSGYGDFSNTVSVITLTSSMPSPTYLTASIRQPNLTNAVELTWNNPIQSNVQIQRVTDLSDLSSATTFSTFANAAKSTFVVHGQEPNKDYYFRIRNISVSDSSIFTEFVHIETGAVNLRPVFDVEALVVGRDILIQWKDTVKATQQYTVYRVGGGGNFLQQLAVLEDTFFIDKTASGGLQYSYTIRSSAPEGDKVSYSQYSPIATVSLPNFSQGTWIAKSPMPAARYDASAFAIGIYGYAGLGYNGAYLDDFYRFDPIGDEWTPIADFPGAARSKAFSFVINGLAYVGGGASPGNNGLKDFYSFNPATNTWTALADFPDDEAGNIGALSSVSFAANGKGYVTMISRTGGVMTRELWEYNPEANEWQKRLNFPGNLVRGGFGIAINNIGYVGLGGVLNPSLEFWRYHALTNEWVQQYNANNPRKDGTATNFLDQLRIIGGDVSTTFTPSYTNVNLVAPDNIYFYVESGNQITGARANAISFAIGDKLYVGTGYNGSFLADIQELNLNHPTTPGLVSELKATYKSDTETELTWITGRLSTSLELELSGDNGLNFTPLATLPITTTSYSLTSLLPNKLYFVRIRTKLFETDGPYNTISFYTKQVPEAPTITNATPASSSFGITLNWTDNAENESGFEIWRSEFSYNDPAFIKVGTTEPNAETFTDSKWLIQNKQYYYKVRAFNESGYSAFTALAFTISPGLKPSAPTNLEVVNAGLGSITLSWMVNSEESITGSVISLSLNNESFSSQNYSNKSSATITGLQNGTKYYVKIASKNFNTISDTSPVVEIITLEAIPTAPTSTQALLISDNSIQLSWTYTTPTYEDGFIVQRALLQTLGETPEENSFINIATLPIDQRGYLDETVEPINYYQYRIMAFSSGGNSLPTFTETILSKMLPIAPAQLSLSRPSDYSLLLEWTDNADNENGFTVQQLNASGEFVSIATIEANSVSYTIQEISPLENHTFRIGAFNEAGVVYGGVQTIAPIPAPDAPTQVTATRDSLTRISLQWTDQSSNEKGFIIQTYDFANDLFVSIDTVAAGVTNFLHADLMETRIYRYRILSYNVAGSNASGVAEVLNIILGVEERNMQIEVSPNPGNGLYTLRINKPIWELAVSSSIGEILSKQSSKDVSSNQIDLSHLPDGVYLFIFKFDNTSEVKRVIKAK
ncbi:hypothetical protein SanaruYs_05390 [Chryseotalea sanaruensis]|uniref:Fibronectin type-III domain-containing protein n=1 Tax=Chryseotalea sanaruensis TaxID=2482724 RepID=A0A401U5T9_9BACT|nr:fibronectin type III domain-containing protein [Chryseotalea sanaruensis]GCC50324.1 hypothetical protein SanaruYs_05390 [Chryseotalea sanaruensis]